LPFKEGLDKMEEDMKQDERKKAKYKAKYKAAQQTAWNWRLLPIQFVVLLLPLILRFYEGTSGYGAYAWNADNDSYIDVFLHGKMVAFLIVTALMLILFITGLKRMRKEEIKNRLKWFIPLFIYLGFVILSTVFSMDIMDSLTGGMDQKEPVGVLLGYVMLIIYVFFEIEKPEDLKQIVRAAVVGALLMASVGVLQVLKMDPLVAEGVQRLYANNCLQKYGPLTLAFPEGMAYGTLFNPNYVGTYVAMYTPLLVIGMFSFHKVWEKLASAVAFLGLVIMLFASQSRTGLIAVIAVAVMLIVFLGKRLWKYWYLVIPGITFLVLSFSLLDTYRDNLLTNRLKAMFAIEKSQDVLHGIDTTGNGVRVSYKDTEFTVMMAVSDSNFGYAAYEGDERREVTYTEDGSYGYFTLSSGEEIAIQTASVDNAFAFGLNLAGKDYYFSNQIKLGDYMYMNLYGKFGECVMPTNIFPGYEAAASGRGYVWGRTIPLLMKYFFIGSGPDTFPLAFPQNDYIARNKSGFENTIFTRPHNFYLQMGVQTGTLSLLAFLCFYAVYFIGSCRRYWFRTFSSIEEWIGFAVFLGSVGFMAAGLANDSLIVVTPVFYVLVGIGMAINQKFCPLPIREKNKSEENKTEE